MTAIDADLRIRLRAARDQAARSQLAETQRRDERAEQRACAASLATVLAGRATWPAAKSIDVDEHLHGVARVVVKALSP